MTCSGWPVKRLRSTGSCVATPTGQVLRWHLRIMMQPAAIKGAVAKPNSSAPSSAPRGGAGGDRADPDFGHQFDRGLAFLIDVLEVVDELRQILDRIDVVMRRRRDQADAGRR